MRTRFLLPVFFCGSTVALVGCADDTPAVPGDGSSTGSSGGTTTTSEADSSTSGGSDTATTSPDPDSTGPALVCGDGLVTDDEACDDANTEDGDGCSAECTVEEGWQCEEQPSACFVVCGDALIIGDEQCDDDNVVDGDGCSAECVLEDGWACEGTPSDCATVCGDGFLVGDFCDDGNVEPGDGCSQNCLPEPGWSCIGEPSVCDANCGDGIVLGDELCDDEDLAPDDGCDAACMVEPGWACMGQPSVCTPGCGDGLVVGSEECDDLDLDDGDGCSAACTTEPGWVCADEPSACVTDCGDGVTVGPEACDDGNIGQGDGCEHDCSEGFGWTCVGSPSVCTETDVVDRVALGGTGGCVLTGLGEVGCFGSNAQGQVGNGTDGVETYVPAFALDDAVAIAAGDELNCAIRADGSVWCWGDNTDRGMGPAAAAGVDQPLPIQVTGVPVSVEIDAGDDHVCTIDGMGQVWCWGDNDNRQLGQGGAGTTDSPAPVTVALPGGLAAIDLGLGQDHSCAVLEDNTVACWGDDDNGQLGDGASGTDNSVATLVPGLAVINDVEAGEDTTCALDDLGQVRCWGLSADGEVGTGTTLDQPTPQLVTLPAAAQAIALGDQFSCALLVDDQVYCWGEGTDFQLASGDLVNQLVPGPVLDVPAVDLVDIDAGGRGVCALSAAGERWCWGYSEEGQLGIAPAYQLEPALVAFSGPVTEVALERSAYRGVICGVLAGGTLECAGDGTLVNSAVNTPAAGYFEPISHHVATPMALPLVSDVQHASMGSAFICVATTTNVQCWGDNSQRQLGQGGAGTADILTPVAVTGLGAVDELDLGTQFACVRTGGNVQCWGDGASLQTGAGGTGDQSAPVTVMNLADAIDIATGEAHACALRATGVVSCWGDDGVGQLGDSDGDTNDSALPVDVTGLPPGVTQIVAGQDHTCALAAGEVYCWGEGQYGNLGQGSEVDSDTALVVPGLTGIVQLASGNNFVCALDGAGDLWCWGYSLDGQLGDGGQTITGLGEVLSPTPFLGASGITSVVAGNSTTCVETAAGWSCVGFRSAGQLGNGSTVEPAVPTPTYFGP